MRARDLNVIIVGWNETTAQISLGNGLDDGLRKLPPDSRSA